MSGLSPTKHMTGDENEHGSLIPGVAILIAALGFALVVGLEFSQLAIRQAELTHLADQWALQAAQNRDLGGSDACEVVPRRVARANLRCIETGNIVEVRASENTQALRTTFPLTARARYAVTNG